MAKKQTKKRTSRRKIISVTDRLSQLEKQIEDLTEDINLLEVDETRDDDHDVYRWTDAEGNKHPLSVIDEGHLRNIVSYCTRRLITRLGQVRFIHQEEKFITGLSKALEECARRGIEV